MEKIIDSLLNSAHPEDVKNKFIVVYLKGSSNSNNLQKADWEQLCEYAYGLITKVPLNWLSYLAESTVEFNFINFLRIPLAFIMFRVNLFCLK